MNGSAGALKLEATNDTDAAASAEGKLPEKAHGRFDAASLAALARVFAREAALRTADEGLRWVVGAADDVDVKELERAVHQTEIHAAQTGLLDDMNRIADVLYDRAG